MPDVGNSEDRTYRSGDAKAYFASERTFLHWLSIAVTLGGLAAGLLGISGEAHKKWGTEYEVMSVAVRVLGLLIMIIAILVAVMASCNFYTRGEKLKKLSDGPYDTRWLPLLAASVMTIVLLVVWIASLIKYIKD